MIEDATEREQVAANRVLRIFYDEQPEDPRSWDNIGTMVHWHRRYNLGDRKATDGELEALKRGGFTLLERYLRRTEGMAVLLKLGLLDHSGLHMWAGGGAHWSDAAGWDSGTVGFIYATDDQLDEASIPDEETAHIRLQQEVETYDEYLRGEVYAYIIEDMAGNVIDSCWGFYGGLDYCRKEALAVIAADEEADVDPEVAAYREAARR